MAYAFSFDCFNRIDRVDDDGYKSKVEQVDVTVIAESVAAAELKVKELVERENYKLEDIVELTELKPSRTSY